MQDSGVHLIKSEISEHDELHILSARAEMASRSCDSERLGRILAVLLDLPSADLTATELNMVLDHENDQRQLDAEMAA